jgi:hypothetical protein
MIGFNDPAAAAEKDRRRKLSEEAAAKSRNELEIERQERKNWKPPKGLQDGGDVRFNRNLLNQYSSVSRPYEFYVMFDLNPDVTELVSKINTKIGQVYVDCYYPLDELKELILNNASDNAKRLMVAVQSTNLPLTHNYEEHTKEFGNVKLSRNFIEYNPLDGAQACSITIVDNAYNFLTALDSIQAKCTLDRNGRYFDFAVAHPFLLKIMKYSGRTVNGGIGGSPPHTRPLDNYNAMTVQATLDYAALNPSKGMDLGYDSDGHVIRNYKISYRRISYDKYTL